MKILVLLLLVLMALSSVSPMDDRKNTGHGKERRRRDNDGQGERETLHEELVFGTDLGVTGDRPVSSLENTDPLETDVLKTDLLETKGYLKATKLNQTQMQHQPSPCTSSYSFLQWETWNDTLPEDAVSINNAYVGRIDYVCKYKCDAGFYNPSKGPYCHYVSGTTVNTGSPFEILVNRDNFDTLEWKAGSHGSVPQNAVRTCPGEGIYVGQNKYGLGKVSTKSKKFYLPWDGSEYHYDSYHVLTANTDNVMSQQIDDVRYTEAQIYDFPPEIIHKTSITNYECHKVTKTDTVSKTNQVQKSWNFSCGLKPGVETSFKGGVPFLSSESIEVSTEVTLDFTMTKSVTDTITDNFSIVFTAPASHSCSVRMLLFKCLVQIPFTARLTRAYSDSDIKTTYITGTYKNIHPADIKSVVEQCKPLAASSCK